MEEQEKKEKKQDSGSGPLKRAGGPNVWIILIVLAVMGVWVLLQAYVLPKFGVST